MAEMTSSPAVAAPSSLRRLPGASPSLRFGGKSARATLWLDDTQLVQESLRSSTQEIQRFALNDIQAIQVRRTARGVVYNAILLAMFVLPLLGLASTWNDRGPRTGDLWFWGSFAGFFAVLLFINILRGPTCRATLTTALGPQLLPSLSRLGSTRRALALITANVAAVQGTLPPDEAARAVDGTRSPAPVPAPASTPVQG